MWGKMGGRRRRFLCAVHQLPAHLQFNKDVLGGYRPPLSARDCLASCLYLHNESFNIISHCAAFIYFVLAAFLDYPSVWPPSGDNGVVVRTFILLDLTCSLLPFLLSVTYHTFMPLWGSPSAYQRLLNLDVLGVWIVCTLGPLSYMYTGLYCSPGLQCVCVCCYLAVSLLVLYCLMLVASKRERVTALTVQLAVRFLLTHPFRLASVSPVSLQALKYYITVDAISAVGALINAHHIPERWLPGKLDYVCNGHTLMHVAAILTVAIGRRGFLLDMAWLNGERTCI